MREIISGQDNIDRHEDFFSFSPRRQRLEYYSNRSQYRSAYCFIYEDDTKLCLGNESRIIRFSNGKAWSQADKDRQGFTYDKTTKKFKFWYKSIPNSFTEQAWDKILAHTDSEWLKPIFNPVRSLMTATMFGKIFSKKITDPIEFCKLFIKSKPWLKNSDMTPDMLYGFLLLLAKEKNFLASYIQIFSVAKSVKPILQRASKGGTNQQYFYHVLITSALALDVKIDFGLSIEELKNLSKNLEEEVDFNYSLLTL